MREATEAIGYLRARGHMVEAEGLLERPSAAVRLRRGLGRHAVGVLAAVVLVAFAGVAVGAPLVAPQSPTAIASSPIEKPSREHLAGTDRLGRDVLSRTIYGARVSLGVGVAAVVIGTAFGVAGGLQAGYAGGRFDRMNQFLLDVGLAFPGILPLLVVVAAFGKSVWIIIAALAVQSVPVVMRVVRGSVLKEKESMYVDAARALGASDARILVRHILPNVMPVIIVLISAGIPAAILAESALSFLGLGIQPPTPSWGGDLSGDAQRFFEQQPWMALCPGIALSITVLAFNLLGDTLRDVLDPRMRGAR
jgi:ABC-type dipeptide/oligopeptide/nickel transport system permease subunit